MPQTEEEVKDSHVSDSPSKIISLWKRIHFSGRVIMCSVLFGLGLILIGGLIFAINVDDEPNKDLNDDKTAVELPTKAPSNYVGPVVMGIGGFIVVVGIIMCLFETQVCRKKTSDTKPLIPDKSDVEVKITDSSPVPSPSRHKNHKHKSRKVSASPKKTKTKHAKLHSREQNQASSKSPPIFIDKSKSFMTSSEENFLTPPNTLSEHAALEHRSSREAEIQTSSSLMKSFTSSGTWNQSTEFLTPTASYKENSVSLDNSVELDEKESEVTFQTNEVSAMDYTRPEFMTPLTTEGERIQEMLNQMKNEKMKTELEQSGGKEIAVNLKNEHGNDANVINAEIKIVKIFENVKPPTNDQLNTSSVEVIADKPPETLVDVSEKIGIEKEESNFSDNILINGNKDSEKGYISNESNTECESPIVTAYEHKIDHEEDNKNGNQSSQNDASEKSDSSLSHDRSKSHIKEDQNMPKFISKTYDQKIDENNIKVDLEASGSSEETLVSHNNSSEILKNNDAQIAFSKAQENICDKSKTSDVSESLIEASSNYSISGDQNSLTDTLEVEKVVANDLIDNETNSEETKNIDDNTAEKSS